MGQILHLLKQDQIQQVTILLSIDNDVLGQFFFAGADGTDLNSIGASIRKQK
jgi:hypothetical protein